MELQGLHRTDLATLLSSSAFLAMGTKFMELLRAVMAARKPMNTPPHCQALSSPGPSPSTPELARSAALETHAPAEPPRRRRIHLVCPLPSPSATTSLLFLE